MTKQSNLTSTKRRTPAVRWEYTTTTETYDSYGCSFWDHVNELGEMGWELVAVIPVIGANAVHRSFFFKRRL